MKKTIPSRIIKLLRTSYEKKILKANRVKVNTHYFVGGNEGNYESRFFYRKQCQLEDSKATSLK